MKQIVDRVCLALGVIFILSLCLEAVVLFLLAFDALFDFHVMAPHLDGGTAALLLLVGLIDAVLVIGFLRAILPPSKDNNK